MYVKIAYISYKSKISKDFMCEISKVFSASGGLCPPDPLQVCLPSTSAPLPQKSSYASVV